MLSRDKGKRGHKRKKRTHWEKNKRDAVYCVVVHRLKGMGEERGQRHALCHECIVHGEDVDLVDALCLELVVLVDISRCLRAARGREGPRHANL
jgi:hypothetical protein